MMELRDKVKSLPWIKILIGLLLLASGFIWWQYQELAQIQKQMGRQLEESYWRFGRDLESMRLTLGRTLISKKMDRSNLQSERTLVRSLMFEDIIFLEHNSKKDLELNRLTDFIRIVQNGMHTLTSKKGPLTEVEKDYIQRVHTKLVELEGIYGEAGNFGWVSSDVSGPNFYAGNKWPRVLQAMENSLGDMREIYQKYGYPEEDKNLSSSKLEIPGEKVSKKEALSRAKEFLKIANSGFNWRQTGSGQDVRGRHWDFEATAQDNNYSWRVQVLETGGHVIRGWKEPVYHDPSKNHGEETVPEPGISSEEALDAAQQFLQERGITGLQPYHLPEYGAYRFDLDGNTGVYKLHLVRRIGNVYDILNDIYLEVNGQTGTVMQWGMNEFVRKGDYNIPEPVLSRDEARSLLNDVYKPQDGPLVYNRYSDLLKYIFLVKEAGVTYEVHINAITGEEEQVSSHQQAF